MHPKAGYRIERWQGQQVFTCAKRGCLVVIEKRDKLGVPEGAAAWEERRQSPPWTNRPFGEAAECQALQQQAEELEGEQRHVAYQRLADVLAQQVVVKEQQVTPSVETGTPVSEMEIESISVEPSAVVVEEERRLQRDKMAELVARHETYKGSVPAAPPKSKDEVFDLLELLTDLDGVVDQAVKH